MNSKQDLNCMYWEYVHLSNIWSHREHFLKRHFTNQTIVYCWFPLKIVMNCEIFVQGDHSFLLDSKTLSPFFDFTVFIFHLQLASLSSWYQHRHISNIIHETISIEMSHCNDKWLAMPPSGGVWQHRQGKKVNKNTKCFFIIIRQIGTLTWACLRYLPKIARTFFKMFSSKYFSYFYSSFET